MTREKIENHGLLEVLTENAELRNEILAYTKNKFLVPENADALGKFTLQEEPYVAAWEEYHKEAAQKGVFETLKTHFAQFRFPIVEGISGSEEYRAAVYKGIKTTSMIGATGLVLNKPETLQLRIHSSIAGKIPVLHIPDVDDFETVVQALSCKNEPKPIPFTMGATMINGINNWSRIGALKKAWTDKNPSGSWRTYFIEEVIPNKALYQDKLIVLSEKEYSGIPADSLGLSKKEWKDLSVEIRLEHECTHFFTLQYFEAMANNMHDELIADYMGIRKAYGSFNQDWFLRCIGLEAYPKYRKGARFENYLGNPALSKEAFKALRTLLKQATSNVFQFDQKTAAMVGDTADRARLTSLCSLDLLEIAETKGAEKLYKSFKQFYKKNKRRKYYRKSPGTCFYRSLSFLDFKFF